MLVSLTILSLISIILVLIPLAWHWRAGNVAIVCMIIWLAWTNLTLTVDTIVWADNVIIHSRIWCDIVTKTWIGFQVAFPVCTFCITFYLEKVASIRNVLYTAEDKRRRQLTEGALCIGVPVLIMILHVIVQGHRFDIVENTGCSPSIYNSWQSFLIIQFPPFVFALLCLVYAVLALRWFIKRRAQFSEHLESSRSGMNGGRYARLMGFAVTQIIFFTVVWSWMYVAQIQSENWRYWDNWANVHSNFGRIAQFPKILLPQSYWNRYYFNLHVIPIVSIFFFVFFGFGQEAMNEYRRIWRFINKYVFRREIKPSASRVLPTFSAPSHLEFSRSRGRTTNNDLDSIIDDKWPYGADDAEAQTPTKDKEAKDITASAGALTSPPPFSNIVLASTDRQDETSSTASSSRIRRSVDGAA